jgi:ethanolamine transporter EutH
MTALLLLVYLLWVVIAPGALAVHLLRLEAHRLEALLYGGLIGVVVVPFFCVEAAALLGVFATPGVVAGIVTVPNGAMAAALVHRRKRLNIS